MDGLSIHESFNDQLKAEIRQLCDELHGQDLFGDQQDGYTTWHLDDGWVSYKGMSWGFTFHCDPLCIDMTVGPDQPFVGYRKIIYAEESQFGEHGLVWVDRYGTGRQWQSLKELAQYGLQCLASKVHETLPDGMQAFFFEKPDAYFTEPRR